MKPHRQRIAIAEACGFKCSEYSDELGQLVAEFTPDYLKDLNAMHEAEEELGSYVPNFLKYLNILKGINPMCVRATAAQRAEAFLRTIGKWEEEK